MASTMSLNISLQKKNRGFTLIELVVVLFILSLMAVLIVPRLPSTQSEELKSSAKTVASTIRYLQNRAVTSSSRYFLKIEPAKNSMEVLEYALDGATNRPSDSLLNKKILSDSVEIKDIFTSRNGKVNDGEIRIEPTKAGIRDFTIIHLANKKGENYTIMIFPSSGKVAIYDDYRESPL